MSSNVEAAASSELAGPRATQRDEAAAPTPEQIAIMGRAMRRTGQWLGLAGAFVMAAFLARISIERWEWLVIAFILVVVGLSLGAHLGWRARRMSRRATFFVSVAHGVLAPLPCGLMVGVVFAIIERNALLLVLGLWWGIGAIVFSAPVLMALSIVAALVLNWRRDVEARAMRP